MLNLTTKGRYATRIMVCLARAGRGRSLRVQDIADSEGIAAAYVEQILMSLRTSGLVRSHRGAKGGFSLGRDPGDITVGHVLAATEGPLCVAPCLGGTGCSRAPECPTQPLWRKVNNALMRTFDSISIGEVAAGGECSQDVGVFAYEI